MKSYSQLVLIAGCISVLGIVTLLWVFDDTVGLQYPTKSEAAEEDPFAKGWLPEIIPDSSRDISMENNLDLNMSEGEFSFDEADHEKFVGRLVRAHALDRGDEKGYEFGEWMFWIRESRDYCRFRFRMAR